MKRIDNLYEQIISIDNLRIADSKARKHKEKKNYGIQIHDCQKENNLIRLNERLKNKTYKTSLYDIFHLKEYDKDREISRLPYYPDRITHHAVMNILEPIWTNLFIKTTYSCIKGRGTTLCSLDVRKAIKEFPKSKKIFFLKLDIKKFYPSINHDILKTIIRKKIKCKDTLWLLDEIIDSAPGVPIGNYVSQYFANLYLTYFDHWVKEVLKVKYYFRYADDIVILSDNRDFLFKIFKKIQNYLNYELKLTVKNNWVISELRVDRKNKDGKPIDFVGFCMYRECTLLRKRIKKNLCKKVYKLNKIKDITFDEYKMACGPWLGWCKYSDSTNLLKKIIKPEFQEGILKITSYDYRTAA